MFRLMEIWQKNKALKINKKAIEICKKSVYFDANWYLDRYPDVKAARMDPAIHYVKHGAAERRNPGPNFSTEDYLLENPKVKEKGINPLVHFEKSGKKIPSIKKTIKNGLAYLIL